MLRVLDGHSLTTKALLYPESMGLNLSERDSTASPTVDRDAPQLQMGDWVQDMDEPGAGIVWRVRTADTQYNTETITYTLEHMINSLADRILPDEVKASDMGGSGDSCTAKQAFQYILGQQSDWELGDFSFSVSNPYHFSGETLKAALETVTNSLEDPVWEYDFTVYPFKLHVRQLSDAVDSELREGRNLTTLKYTIDRTRMYTRFYPVGKNNLKPTGKYVSKNEGTYGRVDKTETDQSKDTEAKLIAWANERLKRHAEPLVTVTISGLDLSAGTGEPLDKMTVCHKCRVPLPAYSTTIIEKVTKLSWRDKIKDKESVTVTLANALADVQSIIKEEKSKSGGGGRTAAELNYGIETTIGNVESACLALSRACWSAGISMAASMAMMAITTSSSIKVKFPADPFPVPPNAVCTVFIASPLVALVPVLAVCAYYSTLFDNGIRQSAKNISLSAKKADRGKQEKGRIRP